MFIMEDQMQLVRLQHKGPKPDQETLTELRHLTKMQTAKHYLDMPLADVRFVVLDTETTGFEVDNGDEVIALGALVVQGGEIKTEHSIDLLVDPQRSIPEIITKLTGINDEMVQGCCSVYDATRDYLKLLNDSIIAGHAVGFDLGFLNNKLSLFGAGRINSCVWDTKTVARYLHPGLHDNSLDCLLDVYGIKKVNRHHAFGDCLLIAQVLLKQISALEQKNVYTVNDMLKHRQHSNYFASCCF